MGPGSVLLPGCVLWFLIWTAFDEKWMNFVRRRWRFRGSKFVVNGSTFFLGLTSLGGFLYLNWTIAIKFGWFEM
jgi:hypothetical protein